MTSRGAVGNPGTLAAAVLWAAPASTFPNCTSGDTACYLSPTGVHEAAGTPGYAEAIYPAFPGSPDRTHVKKCIVNKDGNGANQTGGSLQAACAADAIPAYASADSDMDAGAPYAHGFTRALGGEGGGLTVGGSDANADVRPDKAGNLVSKGYSHATGIDLGGVVQLKAVSAEASVVAAPDNPTAKQISASCTFSGLSIAGNAVPADVAKSLDPKALKPFTDAAKGLGYSVTFIPPPPATVGRTPDGKFQASCTGLRVFIDDIDPSSRTSSRLEYTFGYINIQAAVSNFASGALGDVVGGGLASGAGSVSDAVGAIPPAAGGGEAVSTGSSSATPSGAADIGSSGSGGGKAQVSRQLGRVSANGALRNVGPNAAMVGALSAATASAIGVGAWLLVGVILSLARGTRLRLPGTNLP